MNANDVLAGLVPAAQAQLESTGRLVGKGFCEGFGLVLILFGGYLIVTALGNFYDLLRFMWTIMELFPDPEVSEELLFHPSIEAGLDAVWDRTSKKGVWGAVFTMAGFDALSFKRDVLGYPA